MFKPIWKEFITIEAHDPTKYLGGELDRTAFNNIERYKNIIENYVIHDNGKDIFRKIEAKFSALLEKDKYKKLKKFFRNPKNAEARDLVIRELWDKKLRFYIVSRAHEFSAFRKCVMSFLDKHLIFEKALTANYKDFVAKLIYKTSFLVEKQGLDIKAAVERAINELLLQSSLRVEIKNIINADKGKFVKSMCSYIKAREHAQKAVATHSKALYLGVSNDVSLRLSLFDSKIREREDGIFKKLKSKPPRLGGMFRKGKVKPAVVEKGFVSAAKKVFNFFLRKVIKRGH